MKLLTRWQQWWDKQREEHKFHCDLLLAPGDYVEIRCGNHTVHIGDTAAFAKVHLEASWEYRTEEFAS